MILQVRVLGVPVRIHAWFLLTIVLVWSLAGGSEIGFGTLPIAGLIVLQAFLFHEMGHALVGRAFGLRPQIDLVALFGLTRWQGARPLSPGQSILVSAAGPLVGIVLGGMVLALGLVSPPATDAQGFAWRLFVGANLGWGVLNLIPILPLDGGNVLAALLQLFSRDHGLRYARIASLVFCAALVALSVAFRALSTLVFLAFFAFVNVQGLRAERALRRAGVKTLRSTKDVMVLAHEALAKGDAQAVLRCGSVMLLDAREQDDREAIDEALHLCAWGWLLAREPVRAQECLDQLSGEREPDPALAGAIALAFGRRKEAMKALETALREGPSQFVESRYLEAVESAGAYARATAFAMECPDALSEPGQQSLLAAALSGGPPELALGFGEWLFHRVRDPSAAFNAACALGRLGRAEEALPWLERARQAGFADIALLDADEDLAPVRGLPAWEELRSRFPSTPHPG